jgi:hypothetical protein
MDDKFCYDAFTKLGFSQWKNAQMTFGMIQRDIANSCTQAVTKTIKEEIGVVYSLFWLINHVIYW